MNFDINPSNPTPIFRQIVEQVHRFVASGQLRAGDALPSVRAVALQHAINPMTVSKAYSLLESQGLLERRRGLGMVVALRGRPTSPAQRLALLEPALVEAARQVGQLDVGHDDALHLFEKCLRRQQSSRTRQKTSEEQP